jgi:hypothetical protein
MGLVYADIEIINAENLLFNSNQRFAGGYTTHKLLPFG